MRIITNAGSSLSSRAARYYDVRLTLQKMSVDGVLHETADLTFEQLDELVAKARELPHHLGSTAAECVEQLRPLLARDPELLIVTSSAKITRTFTASATAARILMQSSPSAHITVVDSLSTDIGAGLACILAGEAARSGMPLPAVAELVRQFATSGRSVFYVETLDTILRGGHANFLKAAALDATHASLLTIDGGMLGGKGSVDRSASPESAMAELLTKDLDPRRPVWTAASHGGVPARAKKLLDEIRKRAHVVYEVERPLCISLYNQLGRGSFIGFVYPVDGLPWAPPIPAVS